MHRLKPVAAADKRDRSAAQVDAGAEQERFLRYASSVREVDFEQWFDRLKEHTYASELVPISVADAEALRDAVRASLLARRAAAMAGTNEHAEAKLRVPVLSAEQTALLDALAARIDVVLARFGGVGFAKLSSRSAKDATVERSLAHFHALVDAAPAGSPADSNFKIICLNRAHIQALKVSSGKEVLALFTLSERIFEDLELALEDRAHFAQNVVIRQWVPIPIEYEFRGFVHNRKLNALSQYYHHCYFPELVAREAEIANTVRDFWTRIEPLLPVDSMICDFAVDLANNRVYVLEINPYYVVGAEACGTDAAMFSWKDDRAVLDNGPFEFRLERAPKTDEQLRARLSDEFQVLLGLRAAKPAEQ